MGFQGVFPLNLLPIIHHFPPQDSTYYHLEILREAVVIQIIEVDAHFVGVDYGVVVFHGDYNPPPHAPAALDALRRLLPKGRKMVSVQTQSSADNRCRSLLHRERILSSPLYCLQRKRHLKTDQPVTVQILFPSLLLMTRL